VIAFCVGLYDADRHDAIRGKGVAFERNRAGLRGRHLRHAAIPPGSRGSPEKTDAPAGTLLF
jgi:hypothetical protein